MNNRIVLAATLSILTVAMGDLPAIANPCPSTVAAQVAGRDNTVDIKAKRCGQWSTVVKGANHSVGGIVVGAGSRVVTLSHGWGTKTRADIRGIGNQFGSNLSSGATANVVMRGIDNGAAVRATRGVRIQLEIHGQGNTVWVTATQ